jgi:hypothetical protein
VHPASDAGNGMANFLSPDHKKIFMEEIGRDMLEITQIIFANVCHNDFPLKFTREVQGS